MSQDRIFRNPEKGKVAGVCEGVGTYLNIDPVFIRLAFVLVVFFGGAGVLAYVICWAVIPKLY